jgi:hypothetical protein
MFAADGASAGCPSYQPGPAFMYTVRLPDVNAETRTRNSAGPNMPCVNCRTYATAVLIASVDIGAESASSGTHGTGAHVPFAPAGSNDCSKTTVPTNAVARRWKLALPDMLTSMTAEPVVEPVPARVEAPGQRSTPA